MASGVVIRLKNLPLTAGTIDIRHFFGGLRIPDGGVHIIGGDDGTAFILFSTDEDARRAMLQDGQDLSGAKIRLMLSSHTEMKTVIERSQRICEELRGQRPPEPPITNLSSRSSTTSYQPPQRHFKASSPKITADMMDPNDVHIEIKGMPFSVSQADIIYFFSPLSVSAIRFMLDEKGRKNGTGFVKFASAVDKREGLKRDRKYIGSRFVKLTSATERQWLLASSQACETVRPGAENATNRKRTQTSTSPSSGTPKRSRAFSPLRSDNCVEVRGLPSTATFKLVGDFFDGLHFVEGSTYIEMDGTVCKGTAYVEFTTYSDYKEALSKDGDMLSGKQVRVVSLSKQNMTEQIRRHKKYIKAKKEEALNREKIEQAKKLHEKKSKDDLKRKKDHHLRKQKEMDEWLRRQHEKEQRDRKRRDLEKQVLAQSNKPAKLLEQIQSFQKNENDSHEVLKPKKIEQINKIEESANNVKTTENMEESVSGAGEMDIEDDNNNEATTFISSNANTGQQTVVAPSTALGFSSGLGTSGSVISPPVALNFNTAMPLVNPAFAIPNMAHIQTNLQGALAGFSAPGLMMAKPSFMSTSQPPMLTPPPLPPSIPPTMLPPPTPPNILPVSMPTMISETIKQPNSLLPLQSQPGEPAVESEYVRVANSPYNVTESGIRDFFHGLTIPPRGIQFINRAIDDRRTGHIFIKFLSKEDAAKAALKDDQKLLGRNVLVKVATLATLSQIYEKITKGACGSYVPTFGGSVALPQTTKKHEDSFFTKRILDDKMTCVCIGNVPPLTLEEDIVQLLGSIKYMANRILILRDHEGKCKGDVYVELQTPEECVKAANLHGNAKLHGEEIRVLPLSSHAMEKDIEARRGSTNIQANKLHTPLHPPEIQSSFSKSNGNPVPSTAKSGSHSTTKNVFNKMHPKDRFPPPPLPQFPLTGLRQPFNPRIPPPSIQGDFFKPPGLDGLGSPSLTPLDVMLPPPSQISEDIMRMPIRPMVDPPFGFPSIPPPNFATRFPPPRPPPPLNANFFQTIKMSNLSFKVTREDILEFFSGFDPLPDSVRLMYNNNGKPTGDGVVSFPNIKAAQSAVKQCDSRPLLARKIKLTLQ